jgi:putative ABC transport system permease protein
MLKHALMLIWNRRRANRLVVIEVAAAFVAVFVLLALALRVWSHYQRPLGFVYEDVWSIAMTNERAASGFGPEAPATRATSDDVLDALRRLPRVEAAHIMALAPFVGGNRIGPMGRDANRTIATRYNVMDVGAAEALGVDVVEGRAFSPEDEGQDYTAAVVNRTFVEQAFGAESPVGRRINFLPPEFLARLPADAANAASREIRVVGVIDDFRQHGEFVEPRPYSIQLIQPNEAAMELFVKLVPGTERAYEEQIVATIEAIAPQWRARVTPWEDMRATTHRETLLPFRIGGTLGAFLLAMVVLGLIGIVWQDVVRRTQEIGLRRAAGASAARVRRQIVLEMLVVGAFGIAIGTVVAVQFPLLQIIDDIEWPFAAPALALSAALILVLTVLAALYPAWLASRREPADALRYE